MRGLKVNNIIRECQLLNPDHILERRESLKVFISGQTNNLHFVGRYNSCSWIILRKIYKRGKVAWYWDVRVVGYNRSGGVMDNSLCWFDTKGRQPSIHTVFWRAWYKPRRITVKDKTELANFLKSSLVLPLGLPPNTTSYSTTKKQRQ